MRLPGRWMSGTTTRSSSENKEFRKCCEREGRGYKGGRKRRDDDEDGGEREGAEGRRVATV